MVDSLQRMRGGKVRVVGEEKALNNMSSGRRGSDIVAKDRFEKIGNWHN
jgi:hypothetical protein